jgi:hypothetical protein
MAPEIGVTRKWVLHREMRLTGICSSFPQPTARENREISGCPLGVPPPNAFHNELHEQRPFGDDGIKIMERGPVNLVNTMEAKNVRHRWLCWRA